MNTTFLTGLIGSIILVVASALPEKNIDHPAKSLKNWLFALGGGVILLIYSILSYQEGGSIFFVFLQILVTISCILMMLDIDDRIDMVIISMSSIALIIWSLYLFKGYETLFFVLGLTVIGFGYTFKIGTLRRSIALTVGSILIALFSYFESSWIFFWLNIFFALFSGYYLLKNISATKKTPPHAKI